MFMETTNNTPTANKANGLLIALTLLAGRLLTLDIIRVSNFFA